MGSQSSSNRQLAVEHLDKLLDEALEQTFPASDPVAIDFKQSRGSSGGDPVETGLPGVKAQSDH
jgi:hypothetical protein